MAGGLKPKHFCTRCCISNSKNMAENLIKEGSQLNKEFCSMAKQLGLNVLPNVGCHFAVADEGSPFAILMRETGITRSTGVPMV